MSTWCRTGRHGECEDAGCTCACHLRHLEYRAFREACDVSEARAAHAAETVAMVERCARHQGGLMAIVPVELGNQGDEAAPSIVVQHHAPSDEGRTDYVPLSGA